MRIQFRLLLPLASVLVGIVLLIIYFSQPVFVEVNGSTREVRASSLSVRGVLQTAGIPLHLGDAVTPALDSLLMDARKVSVRYQQQVSLWIDNQPVNVYTTQAHPANLLQELNVRLFPGDRLTVDGLTVGLDARFHEGRYHTVQLNRSSPQDNLPASTPGTMLAAGGKPLLGLDRIDLTESSPYASKAAVITRVQDTILIEQQPVLFEYKSIQDPEVELDQQVVTQQGANGLTINLTRVRSENGIESRRQTMESIPVRDPVDQVLSYGTKAVIKSELVDGIQLDYWRAVSMYATSYSPCRSGTEECLYGTRSGIPVARGVAAVVSRWYPYMQGQRIYVPGYGYATIADTGGGIPGQYWIDLGFSDEDYESWHQWVTVYFLPPVPPNILYVLN